MKYAIIFDCFGVLYIDPSHSFYEQRVTDYDRLRPRLLELNKQQDYGLISQTELIEQVAELTEIPIDEVRSGILGKHRRNQALLEYIVDLRRRGVLVGMLSNVGPGAIDSFFSSRQREELFDAVVLSGEEMLAKPHPEIYRLTAKRLGVDPKHCLMVDDDEDNCAGADAAGMQSVKYDTAAEAIAEVENFLKKYA